MIKFIRRVIFIIILIFVIISSVFIYKGYELYKDALNEKSVNEMVAEIKSNVTVYTSYNELPQDYIDAIIAVEDRNFFKHGGINIISIARAMIVNIKNKELSEGGSTITQQLVKNIYFTQKKEITRKIAEVFMAEQVEKELSKEEIFELYVNCIYFGDGYYNVYDASMGYFNKKPSEMNLFESSLLAGIPNAPSVYSPNVNKELSKQRHMQVLYKMVKFGYLTQKEADEVLEEYNN